MKIKHKEWCMAQDGGPCNCGAEDFIESTEKKL